MIINFKIFENLNNISVGDYVLINSNDSNIYLKKFINNNIGKVFHIMKFTENVIRLKIVYENIPSKLDSMFQSSIIKNDGKYRQYNIDDVVLHAKTKEELELKMKAKKYNIL
jgi:hypothetical protein